MSKLGTDAGSFVFDPHQFRWTPADDPELKPGRLTDRSKRVLALAEKAADEMKHSYVGTEHLLIGLCREANGVAVNVLKNLGVTAEKVEAEVRFLLGIEPADGDPLSVEVLKRFGSKPKGRPSSLRLGMILAEIDQSAGGAILGFYVWNDFDDIGVRIPTPKNVGELKALCECMGVEIGGAR